MFLFLFFLSFIIRAFREYLQRRHLDFRMMIYIKFEFDQPVSSEVLSLFDLLILRIAGQGA